MRMTLRNLWNKQAETLPTIGEHASEVGNELAINLPGTLALSGLAGGGLGALGGLATGAGAARGSAIGAGAGIGGTVGAGLGSGLAQLATRIGGPMLGLKINPQSLRNADLYGTIAGGLAGVGGGAYIGHRVSNKDIEKKAAIAALKQAVFGLGGDDSRENIVPGRRITPKRVIANADTKEKIRVAGIPKATPRVMDTPESAHDTISRFMTQEYRDQQDKYNPVPATKKAFLGSPEARAGENMFAVGGQHANILPYAGLSGAFGGAIGYGLGDTAGGVGGGAGAALGGAGGNIVGAGLGGLGGSFLARSTGIKDPAVIRAMVDQWAQGGGNVGHVLGSLYGGYKGIGLARRLAEEKDHQNKTSSFSGLFKRAIGTLPVPLPKPAPAVVTPAGGAAAAAGATPKANPSAAGLLGGLWPPSETSKMLAGAGIVGMGGVLVNSQLRNAERYNIATGEGIVNRAEDSNFLKKQHEMEMARQEALLHKLKYGY